MLMTAADIAAITQELIIGEFPQLRLSPMRVMYSHTAPYLFAVRRANAGIAVVVNISLKHPRLMQLIRDCGVACLEVAQERTTAVEVRNVEQQGEAAD